MSTDVQNLVVKRVRHPLKCRLPPQTTFPVHDPASLVGTGFISIALAIFTAFRITPAYLLNLLSHIKITDGSIEFFRKYGSILIYSWLTLFFVPLIAGGIIMTPWALLLLYFDGLFWLSLTMSLNILTRNEESVKEILTDSSHILPFSIIYTDIALFMVIHMAFATYYITAELTVIENFF